jgi:hypothetical protein
MLYGENSTHLDEAGVRVNLTLNTFGVEHNTWYFEYPNGDIDTLYVEHRDQSFEQARKDECSRCIAPFPVVRLNGKDAYKHPTLRPASGKPIFVLEK